MTRLIFVTQLIDPGDPVLGFVVRQVQVLARHVERLDVVANEVRMAPAELGAPIVSLEKEKGRGQAGRGLRYGAVVTGMARRLRPATILAHMCPIYLNLAAPIAKAFDALTLLWFVHPSDTASLRLAERLADGVVTALPASYPRSSAKVRHIGHAIDTEAFAVTPVDHRQGSLRLLAVGRTSPVKGYPTVIRAVARARAAGVSAELTIVGPSTNDLERRHRHDLRRLVGELSLDDVVRLSEGVAPADVPPLVKDADTVVNATLGGSADKVVFEAMACGRPALFSSPAFEPLVAGSPLELRFSESDPAALADRMVELSQASAQTLIRLGGWLRDRVERQHSLEHWAAGVAAYAEELRLPRAARRPAGASVSD